MASILAPGIDACSIDRCHAGAAMAGYRVVPRAKLRAGRGMTGECAFKRGDGGRRMVSRFEFQNFFDGVGSVSLSPLPTNLSPIIVFSLFVILQKH